MRKEIKFRGRSIHSGELLRKILVELPNNYGESEVANLVVSLKNRLVEKQFCRMRCLKVTPITVKKCARRKLGLAGASVSLWLQKMLW